MNHDVYVNARFLTQPITGVQRFAVEICVRLKKVMPTVRFIAPKNILHHDIANQLEAISFGSFKGHLWEQLELPFFLKKHQNPILVNLCNTAPLLYKKNIVTIHDLAFLENPEWFSKKFYYYYCFLIPRIAHKSLKIITVSQFSKNEIQKRLKINPHKIEVVHNAVSDFFRQKAKSENKALSTDNYILTVSSLDPRKNLKNLLNAFDKVDIPGLKLLIVGTSNASFSHNFFKDFKMNNPQVLFLGRVTDEELLSLYHHAKLFVYLPFYEGFGIPPLEAMACGCPTIVSDIPSLREICEDSVVYTQPHSISHISDTISKVLCDIDLISLLKRKGEIRSAYFDWNVSKDLVASIIKNYL